MNPKDLQARITRLEDIEEIKKVQRMYGYYLDNDMYDEVLDLISDNAESVEIADHGVFLGKKGAISFFKKIMGRGGTPPPELSLHMVFQIQGVVDVDENGKTAKGRWHGWQVGTKRLAGVNRAMWGHGVYENEYIKENGKWKFKKLYYNLTFRTSFEDGWIKVPMLYSYYDDPVKPDKPPTALRPYPSGHVVPYHWKQSKKKK